MKKLFVLLTVLLALMPAAVFAGGAKNPPVLLMVL